MEDRNPGPALRPKGLRPDTIIANLSVLDRGASGQIHELVPYLYLLGVDCACGGVNAKFRFAYFADSEWISLFLVGAIIVLIYYLAHGL